jgi:hypothetical protein
MHALKKKRKGRAWGKKARALYKEASPAATCGG